MDSMSNLTVYANEPATRGKVVLHTTVGPLDVELWPKEAPLAVRNFVQLGLEGYYDGCIFHRVIKDFMAQTGDPNGTGKGGESVYSSGTFKDEFHGRLRFTHRGLLGMASTGPDTNGSQFFITLDRCEWLDRKHTIFGKVTGNSLYNLPRFNDLEVDASDRPLYPPRISRVEVLLEPFDDIVPRAPKAASAAGGTGAGEGGAPAAKKRKKEKKNLALLSFGAEAAEEEAEIGAMAHTVRSSHDVLNDPRLSRTAAVDSSELDAQSTQQAAAGAKRASAQTAVADAAARALKARVGGQGESAGETEDGSAEFEARMLQQMAERRQRLRGDGKESSSGKGVVPPSASASSDAASKGAGSGDARADVRAEYESLRAELASSRERSQSGSSGWKWRGKGGSKDDDDDDDDDDDEQRGMSELERQRAKFLQKKRESAGLSKKQRQEATLQKLKMFQNTLGGGGGGGAARKVDEGRHAGKQDAPGGAEGDGAFEWKQHSLRYDKQNTMAESASHYDSFDPLKHGEDAARALAKIKERERAMLSMKNGFDGLEDV